MSFTGIICARSSSEHADNEILLRFPVCGDLLLQRPNVVLLSPVVHPPSLIFPDPPDKFFPRRPPPHKACSSSARSIVAPTVPEKSLHIYSFASQESFPPDDCSEQELSLAGRHSTRSFRGARTSLFGRGSAISRPSGAFGRRGSARSRSFRCSRVDQLLDSRRRSRRPSESHSSHNAVASSLPHFGEDGRTRRGRREREGGPDGGFPRRGSASSREGEDLVSRDGAAASPRREELVSTDGPPARGGVAAPPRDEEGGARAERGGRRRHDSSPSGSVSESLSSGSLSSGERRNVGRGRHSSSDLESKGSDDDSVRIGSANCHTVRGGSHKPPTVGDLTVVHKPPTVGDLMRDEGGEQK